MPVLLLAAERATTSCVLACVPQSAHGMLSATTRRELTMALTPDEPTSNEPTSNEPTPMKQTPSNSPSKPPPKGWPRISSAVFHREPRRAIDFLCAAFGFEVQLLVEGEEGDVHHSQLTLGGGLVMVSGERVGDAATGGVPRRSPASGDGANTQAMMGFVDSADEHCERARAAGATIATEPATTDFGEGYWVDRSYQAIDSEGHTWWFTERVSG